MIVEIIVLAFLTLFLIFGVHAVTRRDKLLSFLGVYIKEEQELEMLNDMLNVDRIALQETFFDDMRVTLDLKQKVALVQKYEESHQRLENFHERYFELEQKIGKKRNIILWRVISPFAPMLTECLTCMSSFWTLIVFSLYFSGLNYQGISVLVLFLPFVVAGLVEIIFKIGKQDFSQIAEAIEKISE